MVIFDFDFKSVHKWSFPTLAAANSNTTVKEPSTTNSSEDEDYGYDTPSE